MIRAVLFDLDGTLLDSAPDLVAALNWLRARNGLEQLSLAAMRNCAGRGAVGLLEAGMPASDPETVEAWRIEFLSRYEQHSFERSSLFEGVSELLSTLGARGIPWGIVTNKPKYLTLPIIESAGLKQSLGCLVCGDTIEQRKPHPAPVLLGCSQLEVLPEQTLFVGDDVRDLEAGRAARTMVGAAHYGYGSGDLLKPEHAHLLRQAFAISHPRDLAGLLQ